MLYTAKGNEKYTDLAIYFDENFYSKERDDEKCYRAMYLIYYMLACKKQYFRAFDDYDTFAQYAATTVYIRFLNKWRRGERIKSLLNYAKASVYPLCINFKKQEFNEPIVSNEDPSLLWTYRIKMREAIQEQYNEGLPESIVESFKEVPKMIKEILDETPYVDDKIVYGRLYKSCLISLIKSFTLSKYSEESIEKRNEKDVDVSKEFLAKTFKREQEDAITLWRLDDSMRDYVDLLVKKIKYKMSDEINDVIRSYALPVDTIDDILTTQDSISQQDDYLEGV